MTTEPFSLTFSDEELVLLMTLLEIPDIFGIPKLELANMPQEMLKTSMITATRGLQARGFIQLQSPGQPIVVYTPIVALLGAASMSSCVVVVDYEVRQPQWKREQHFYYTGDRLFTEYQSIEPGLHAFSATDQIQDYLSNLYTTLGLNQQETLSALSFLISKNMFMYIQDSSLSNFDTAYNRLLQSEIDIQREAAYALVDSLNQRYCTATISKYHIDNGELSSEIGLIVSSRHVWCVENIEDSGSVNLRSISADDATTLIQSIFSVLLMGK